MNALFLSMMLLQPPTVPDGPPVVPTDLPVIQVVEPKPVQVAKDEWSVVRNSNPWDKGYTVEDLKLLPEDVRLPDVTIYRSDTAVINLFRPTPTQVLTALETVRGGRQVSRTALPKALPTVQPEEPVTAGPLPDAFDLGDLKPYKRAMYTQALDRVGSFSYDNSRIQRVHRNELEAKWHQSGGMLGVEGFRSDLYRNDTATEANSWVGMIPVVNSFGHTQYEQGYKVEYPNGSKFMDVLSNGGKVFEARQRLKVDGKWQSSIVFEDKAARPFGYTGLTVSCNSCHKEAGTGKYGLGLVPGGDGVLSVGFKPLEFNR